LQKRRREKLSPQEPLRLKRREENLRTTFLSCLEQERFRSHHIYADRQGRLPSGNHSSRVTFENFKPALPLCQQEKCIFDLT
jgi:hypothetical protein